ncbi:MAG: asparagine synthase-related protein, partial [Alphaproteobacteria bacterium]|nr:asparagine synthase-related protein [Alphaproteobacteria bacterium]
DLSQNGHQPLTSDSKQQALVYNGEIYNFSDFSFNQKTQSSDTQTLFHLLQTRGPQALEDLNGMWALAYADLNQRKIFLSRDRYGKKPLYYYHDSERFIASSEIKSIYHLLQLKSRVVSNKGLAAYLLGKQTPFLNGDITFYQSICSLSPGEVAVFDMRNRSLNTISHIGFSPYLDARLDSLSETDFLSKMRSDISDAIRVRMRSDVPITVLASGGVDSSWIVGGMLEATQNKDQLSLYTCDILNEKDEANEDLHYVRLLAKALKLPLEEIRVHPLDEKLFLETCTLLAQQVELPLNFFLSTIPTYLMTKSMHERGNKVVLDGVGGDEVMGGYPNYGNLCLANMNKGSLRIALEYYYAWEKYELPSYKKNFEFLKSVLKSSVMDSPLKSTPDHMLDLFGNIITSPSLLREMSAYAKQFFIRERLTSLTERQIFEIHHYQLPYYLGIADQMSMINSIENRSPYLDVRLYKYIYCHNRYKFRDGYNKYALRRTMPDSIPDAIRWRKGKIGIGNSFSHKLMSSKSVYETVMNSIFIRSILSDHALNTLQDNPQLLRPLFSLALLDQIYKLDLNVEN